MSARPDRSAAWRLPACVGLLFLLAWWAFQGYWLDDAFITFRYARNLAEGVGPVFNPGERVEGTTTFLWMLLSSLPFALFGDALALRVLELSGAALGVWVLWRTATFPGPDGSPRQRPFVLLLAVCPVFVINCADGMETPLFTALMLEAARAFLRGGTAGAGAVTGGWLAAAVLTRPEALPLILVLPALRALVGARVPKGWALGFGVAAGAPIVAQLAWRTAFYGALWPNTFAAKATGALAPRLERGAADLWALLTGATGAGGAVGTGADLAAIPPLWLWAALALALLGLRRLGPDPAPGTRLWLAVLWIGVTFRAAFDLWSGSEYMGTFRFLAPALPLLFVLADEGAREATAWVPSRLRAGGVATGLALGVLAGGVGCVELARAREPYREGLESAHIALGRWLARTRVPDTWVAVGDAGAIPFFSRLPVIDLWGLSDATIAQLPGEYGRRAGVADYALGRRPGIIVLWNLAPIEQEPGSLRILGAQPFDREIAAHPVFRREYRFVREWTFREATAPGTGYYLDVFEHRPRAAPRQDPARPPTS